MAFPTVVNSQITDAVTQANVKVLGDAPAIAMSNLYQATAQALSLAAHQATSTQQSSAALAQAATSMGISLLYSIDTAATGIATKDILADNVVGHLQSQMASPSGKSQLQEAVNQANEDADESSRDASSSKVKTKLYDSVCKAIKVAMSEGVSKQQVCHIMHQAAYDHKISLIYPFETDGKKISSSDIIQYYRDVINAHYSKSSS